MKFLPPGPHITCHLKDSKEHLLRFLAGKECVKPATGSLRATSPLSPPNQEAFRDSQVKMQCQNPRGLLQTAHIYLHYHFCLSWVLALRDNTLKMWHFYLYRVQGESLTKCKHNGHLLTSVCSNLHKTSTSESVGVKVNTTAQLIPRPFDLSKGPSSWLFLLHHLVVVHWKLLFVCIHFNRNIFIRK